MGESIASEESAPDTESDPEPDVGNPPPDAVEECLVLPGRAGITSAARFDGDERDDLFLWSLTNPPEGDSERKRWVAFADGGCAFEVVETPYFSASYGYGGGLGNPIGDFDGNGLDDWLGYDGDGTPYSVQFVLSQPGRTFTTSPSTLFPDGYTSYDVHGVADVDADGVLEAMVGAYDPEAFPSELFAVDYGASMTPLVSQVGPIDGVWYPADAANGDFDGDGLVDYAYSGQWPNPNGNAADTPIYVWLGKTMPTYEFLVLTSGDGVPELVAGDFDGDGFDDLVASFGPDDWLFRGSPSGPVFEKRFEVAGAGWYDCETEIRGAFDINGDGEPETLIVGALDDPDCEHQLQGVGTIDLDTLSLGTVHAFDPRGQAADVDGDGAVEWFWLEYDEEADESRLFRGQLEL